MTEILYANFLSVQDYNKLRESVGFSKIPEEKAQTGLNNSTYVVAAKCADQTVGTARLISDGGYVAYIADVIVLPEFQKRGIGKTMIAMILEYIESNMEKGDRVMVCLMAAKGRESFYKQFNFIARPDDQYGAGMSQWISK